MNSKALTIYTFTWVIIATVFISFYSLLNFFIDKTATSLNLVRAGTAAQLKLHEYEDLTYNDLLVGLSQNNYIVEEFSSEIELLDSTSALVRVLNDSNYESVKKIHITIAYLDNKKSESIELIKFVSESDGDQRE